MLHRLRQRLAHSRFFSFNATCRDAWVRARAAEVPAGSRVLDVGAGSCPYRGAFAHCRYETQDFVQLGAEQLRYGSYGTIDYVCDARSIPVADASFDAVLCTEVLEHVPDPCAVVREIARVLRPGGILILTAPLGSGIHQEPYHFYGGYTPYWYRLFLGDVGFRDVTVEPNGGSFAFFAQECIRFVRATRPLRLGMPLALDALWLPFWVLLAPLLAVFVPAVCRVFDRFDRERRFTVGYHVTATRAVAARQ
ncbi:MAG: methyltransferase domain-containing protein [Betaproteobacteria bacterium]|nr:methyltransferase domain-containing protein [Betaproteobacteria bacterium]